MKTDINHPIIKELTNILDNYKSDTVYLFGDKELPFIQEDMKKTISFYVNSQYLGGKKDSLGRDKPFYNIVNINTDVSIVATDLDTKEFVIEADERENFVKAMILRKELEIWMRDTNFAQILNDGNTTRARWGALLLKKTEGENGELVFSVPEWKNLITDSSNIYGTKIEIHRLLPHEIAQKKDVWDKDAIKNLIKEHKSSKDDRITIYELSGMFPTSYLDGENDENSLEYSNQCWYIGSENNKFEILYQEGEEENKYEVCYWKKRDGRSFGVGVVEEGEEAQVWTNDSIIKLRSVMEYTSKVIAQSSSKNLKGKNIVTEVIDGQVIEIEDGKPISTVNLVPSGGLVQFYNLIDKWWSQYERTTSAYDAVRGETPPSGQAFRLQALVQQQGSSQFDYRKQEYGNFWVKIFDKWVIPHLIKRVNKEHTLSSDFTSDELEIIDRSFASYEANKYAKNKVLWEGKAIGAEEYNNIYNESLKSLSQTRNKRFLNIPDGYFDNFKAKIRLLVTNEQKNKTSVLESLSNIFMILQKNPAVIKDKTLSELFGKIIEYSGVGINPSLLSGLSGYEQEVNNPVTNTNNTQNLQNLISANAQPETLNQLANDAIKGTVAE